MINIGKYSLPNVDICRGQFSTIQKCVLKNNMQNILSIKLLSLETNENLMLDLFLKSLTDDQKVYKKRDFGDEKGNKCNIDIDFIAVDKGIAFVLPIATNVLNKLLEKRYEYFHSEFEALTVFTQIMKSYRRFYNLKIPYKLLNPANILQFHLEYVLTCPSTLITQPEPMNPDSTFNDYDYLYTAPEVLKAYSLNQKNEDSDLKNDDFYLENGQIHTNEEYNDKFERIIHKQDVWGIGVILYRLLFGQFPFQHPDTEASLKQDSFLKSSWTMKKKGNELVFRWYWYYQHIMTNPLQFPTKNIIHKSIIDLLNKMLDKNPETRISFGDLKKHPFLNYFILMHQSRQKGVVYRITQVEFQKCVLVKEKQARKNLKEIVRKNVKEEFAKNKQRRNTLKEKHRQARIKKRNIEKLDKMNTKIANEPKTPNQQISYIPNKQPKHFVSMINPVPRKPMHSNFIFLNYF